jgi:hypothetical protein
LSIEVTDNDSYEEIYQEEVADYHENHEEDIPEYLGVVLKDLVGICDRGSHKHDFRPS